MATPRYEQEFPVELDAPDITPYRRGNTGIDYVTTFDSGRPGPHVAIVALVHGNEVCGAIALDWLFRQNPAPRQGKLSLVFANVEAHALWNPADPTVSRWVDEDFNRLWSDAILDGGRDSAELRRARDLRPLFAETDYLLDIHSLQTPMPPLMLSGPLAKGRDFARRICVPPLVVTDSGHAQGPRLRDYRGFSAPDSPKNALLVEAGQHWAKGAADMAIETSVRFMRACEIVAADFAPEIGTGGPPPQRFVEVTDRVTIATDDFVFADTYIGGEVLQKAGTVIGHDGGTPVVTPYDNCVLIMPTRRPWKGMTAVRLGRFVTN